MREVMVMVAPNGARRTKADHPALPITAAELAADAAACAAAGAAAIHLHVRDGEGRHSLDPDRYRDAVAAVREAAPGVVIQVTTEAADRYAPGEQMASVRSVRPEAVSLALRELIADASNEREARAFLSWVREAGIAPQVILYTPEEVSRCLALVDRGVIPFASPFLLFVLGRHSADRQSAPADLDPFVAALGGRDLPWAMCAFGRRECECALHAARLGGHVRVGFENNLHLPDGRIAPSNAALVEAAADLLRAEGFAIMDGTGARALMGLDR
ncbi:MAG TPA: 3-keto-5-aminohexanoate cleavage protein [Bauldia sp.]|nr:3-keto-5-aminohexanoate cleavage protein [Bauldia sp.]